MAWTNEMIDTLKKMWKEGLTTGEIGRRLGVSKNSIVGKVHRLQLDGRPSPIKKKDEAGEKKPAKTTAQSKVSQTSKVPQTPKAALPAKPAPAALPKIPQVPRISQVPQTSQTPKAEPRKEEKKPEKTQVFLSKEMSAPIIPNARPKSRDGRITLTDLDNHTCRWPLGDPTDENFHFCGKKVRVGQTYCDEHSATAYVRTIKK